MAVADDFNRADGALTSPWVQMVGGQNIAIVSGQVHCDVSGSYALARYNAAFATDQYSEVLVAGVGTGTRGAGVACRINPAADRQAYLAYDFFGTIRVARINGSGGPAENLLDTKNVTLVNGDVLRIEVEGSTIRTLVNGVPISSVTDATYAAGQAGLFAITDSQRLDDWEGGDLAAAAAFLAAHAARANPQVLA
jgi:hypothetical protein